MVREMRALALERPIALFHENENPNFLPIVIGTPMRSLTASHPKTVWDGSNQDVEQPLEVIHAEVESACPSGDGHTHGSKTDNKWYRLL